MIQRPVPGEPRPAPTVLAKDVFMVRCVHCESENMECVGGNAESRTHAGITMAFNQGFHYSDNLMGGNLDEDILSAIDLLYQCLDCKHWMATHQEHLVTGGIRIRSALTEPYWEDVATEEEVAQFKADQLAIFEREQAALTNGDPGADRG